MAVPVKKGEDSAFSHGKNNMKVRFSKKGTGGGQKKFSLSKKEFAGKKENRKPSKFKKTKKAASQKKQLDDFYDITKDETVCAAKELIDPEQRLLDARVAMGGFYARGTIRAQPEGVDCFFDGFRMYHYEGRGGVQYIGIVGGFLSAISAGKSVLALATIPIEEGSASSISLEDFISEIQDLCASLVAEEGARWDLIIFWLEALQEHAEALRSEDFLDFQEVLGIIHNLNRWFIEYLEQVLEADEPVIEQQEQELLVEEGHYLPSGLFNLNNNQPLAREHLMNAFQPGAFGNADFGGWLF